LIVQIVPISLNVTTPPNVRQPSEPPSDCATNDRRPEDTNAAERSYHERCDEKGERFIAQVLLLLDNFGEKSDMFLAAGIAATSVLADIRQMIHQTESLDSQMGRFAEP
jgi:hypothetical protein